MTEVDKLRADIGEVDEVDEPTSRERALRAFALAALLIIAVIVAYQQAWRAGFIWDDDMYVTANQLLTAPDGLKKIWFSLESPSQYFPLVYTSFRFEHLLWGLNPVGYHWINFILHAANALLLWRILANLRIPGAWLGAALFALHPVQVESVAWISERKNVLMGFFYLLAVLAWVKFVAGKHKDEVKFYLLALLCFLLALFSKTTACTLPIALLLVSWLKRGSISLQRIVQLVPFLAAGVGMGLVSMWWERYHQGTQGELFSIGLIERLLVAARAFWFYLIKLAWPAQLAFSYPRWDISAKDPTAYYWLGGCLLLIAALWVLRRWLGRGPEVALAFFAVTLAPVLGFVMLYTFRYTFVADHYLYIASIGPLALVAAAVTTAINPLPRIARQALIILLAAALLIPLAFRTWQHSAAFVSEEALWRATLKVNPSSWMAHNNLAILYLRQGKPDEAMTEYNEALRLDPNYAEAHYNLANALLRQGRFSEARMHFERAIELNPRMAVAHANLGTALLELGETRKAIEEFEATLKIDPRLNATREQLAQALLFLGRREEALPQLQTAAAGTDDTFEVHNQIASLLLGQGKVAEARTHAARAVELNPQNAAARTNLGIILAELGETDEAISHFLKALAIEPNDAQAHYNLGNTYLDKKQVAEASAEFRRAVELKPDYTAARLNLANTLLETGQAKEAVTEYERVLEIRPDYARAHTNLANALNSVGRYDEAMDHLQTAWKLEAQARSASPSPTP